MVSADLLSKYSGLGVSTIDPFLSETVDPSIALTDVLDKYPRLKDIHDPKKTQVIFANSSRAALAGNNQLEYWPSTEEGTPTFPHPNPGNTVLEVYNDKLKTDPKSLRTAIFGDLLHGMTKDPIFSAYRDKFANNFTKETLDFEAKKGDKVDIDAYIRGLLAPDSSDEFRRAHKKTGKVYSPEQLKIIKQMQKYLNSKRIK